MNRRGFLGALAAALTLDPERALWVPGKKLISIPALQADFDMDQFVDAYIRPAAQRLADQIEVSVIQYGSRFDVLYGFGTVPARDVHLKLSA